MKIARDLVVHGSRERLDGVVETMTARARPPWGRALEGEARIRDGRYRVFVREGDDRFPAVAVALILEPGRLEVVNITPRDTGALSTDSYNALLTDFSATLLVPATQAQGLGIVTSLPTTSLRAELGDEVAGLLEQFSGAANMASGSSHPADFARWARFLVAVHRSGKRLDPDLLLSTLLEQGWPGEKARTLVGEHGFAEALLGAIDREAE